jgi:hypothetical protein
LITTGTQTIAGAKTLTGNTVLTQTASASGSPNALVLTGAAHTTLTASTEATDVNFNLARTIQFATGALTTQRAMRIQAPTYSFVAASTITTASTLSISGPPVAGTNATITTKRALSIETGDLAVVDGSLRITSSAAIGPFTGGDLYLRGTLLMSSQDNYFTNKIHFSNGGAIHAINYNGFGIGNATEIRGWYDGSSFIWKQGNMYGWSDTTSPYGSSSVHGFTSNASDVTSLVGYGATFALRAQTFRIHNTYTSATSYETLNLKGKASANFEIGPENGSAGGTLRGLTIGGYAAGSATIASWLSFTSAGVATFAGQVIESPPATVTLATNGQFSIEMTSNTAGNLVYRGSDGTTRRAALIFA